MYSLRKHMYTVYHCGTFGTNFNRRFTRALRNSIRLQTIVALFTLNKARKPTHPNSIRTVVTKIAATVSLESFSISTLTLLISSDSNRPTACKMNL